MTASEQPLWQIIANPAAGGGKMARRWPEIERCLQELGIAYSVQFTEKRGHAARLLEDALLKSRRHILGIGGDGTNHEIANGILSQNIAPSTDVFYALLPSGTGNDWARMHGISTGIRTRLQALLEPKTVLQDAGLVQYVRDGKPASRYFVNVAGLAYDAFIAKKVEENGITYHVVGQGETMFSISKRYGLTIKQLAELNDSSVENLNESLGLFKGKIKKECWVEQAKHLIEVSD